MGHSYHSAYAGWELVRDPLLETGQPLHVSIMANTCPKTTYKNMT